MLFKHNTIIEGKERTYKRETNYCLECGSKILSHEEKENELCNYCLNYYLIGV